VDNILLEVSLTGAEGLHNPFFLSRIFSVLKNRCQNGDQQVLEKTKRSQEKHCNVRGFLNVSLGL
jgi:hypothetical protein